MIHKALFIAMILAQMDWILAQIPVSAPTTAASAGQALWVGDELLRDYQPRSTLVTPVTPVLKPAFPAVDIHCHWSIKQDPARMLAAMDELGISHAVNLSGSFGAEFEQLISRFHAVDRERFIFFANLDFSTIDQSNFTAEMCRWLEQAKQRGAKGLKIFKSLGLDHRDNAGNLIAIDDPRLAAVWEKCGELGLPVLIHSADPVPFFQPVDQHNERWMQLRRNPDWGYFGRNLPSWEQLIAARNRVIARHAKTTFIVAHMAEGAHDYATLSSWLDACPNMHVDLSARENEYGRQPFASRKFFIRYADRILFGTDRYPGRIDQPRNLIYYRILETSDEYFDYFEHPFAPMGEWKVYGLSLPEDVLEKIYRGNAKRILNLK